MIAWKIGGEQGEGIDSTGDLLAAVANRMGYFIYGYKSFSSRIKGGHTTYKVRIAREPVEAPVAHTDILIALNQETIDRHKAEVVNGVIVADEGFHPTLSDQPQTRLLVVPLTELARQAGSVLMRNIVSVGVSAALMGLPTEPFLQEIDDKFNRKGAPVVEANQRAFWAGYEKARQALPEPLVTLEPPEPGRRIMLTGNEAIALGALAGGCRLMFGYPITPATDIMEALSQWLPVVGGAVVQMEDELGSITAAIGAGYAGARAMTATSGPGFSLMQEGIGLATMAEIPVVIVDTQRGGPSTGMPTKPEQSDLMAMIHGGHGDSPRIVLTPGSVAEAFEDAHEAFNLADRFQTPVIIASDLSLALWPTSVDEERVDGTAVRIDRGPLAKPDILSEGFLRYQLTESGVSPRALPGMLHGQFLATGVEHGPSGKVSEDPGNRYRMMEKRLKKLARLVKEKPGVAWEGSDTPDLVLVGIGSTVGAIREAERQLQAEGHHVAILWLRYVSPFPIADFQARLARVPEVLVVEQNATGQLSLIMREAGVWEASRFHSVLKFDGVPFFPEEIIEAARPWLARVEVTR